MRKLRFLTAGESHGQGLVGILEGLPAGIPVDEASIQQELARRQAGYGRGRRMQIESDKAQILSGVRFGRTLGSPVALLIENKDWKNWQDRMSVAESDVVPAPVTVPRPGHADFSGAIKYGQEDIRNILERASARETAMRVGLGAIAKRFLSQFDIEIVSHVQSIHTARSAFSVIQYGKIDAQRLAELREINQRADRSPVRCLDMAIEKEMMKKIDEARAAQDTVGGAFEVIALKVPVGLGSHVHWDRKLDARIASAMMSIPAMKGVEIGLGFAGSAMSGSQVHDPFYFDEAEEAYYRGRNHAGGLEGGVTNGLPVVVRVAMKPISTLMRPLDSVNMQTREATPAHVERSDVCAVPAASVIGETMLALVLADAFLEKFGGDSLEELKTSYSRWRLAAAKR